MRGDLSSQEQRLLASMICRIHPNDSDFKEYDFAIKEFCEKIGVSGRNYYLELKKISKNLIKKIIEIEDEEGGFLQVSWLASAYYKSGRIKLSFHPRLKPFLLQLQRCFTQIELKYYFELNSKYAQRIYEYCKQYQAIGKRRFNVSDLRSMFGFQENELKL